MMPGANVIKNYGHKLRFLVMSWSVCPCKHLYDSIVICELRQEPTQVKHLSGAPLYGMLNSLGWKGLPGANTLAYRENS